MTSPAPPAPESVQVAIRALKEALDTQVHPVDDVPLDVLQACDDVMLGRAVRQHLPLLLALLDQPAGEGWQPDRLRMTICTRERTQGNIYNYDYWKCGHCLWHPGGSDGPPNERCLNCGRDLYTKNAREAAMLIRIVPWEAGLHFEIVEDLAALRRLARQPLPPPPIPSKAQD